MRGLSYNFLVFCIAICIAMPCEGKKYGLKEKYFRWMPYKGNETLIFKADSNRVDTIFLTGGVRRWALNDPLAEEADKYETYVITNKYSDPFLYNVQHRYLEGAFVEVEARGKARAV